MDNKTTLSKLPTNGRKSQPLGLLWAIYLNKKHSTPSSHQAGHFYKKASNPCDRRQDKNKDRSPRTCIVGQLQLSSNIHTLNENWLV